MPYFGAAEHGGEILCAFLPGLRQWWIVRGRTGFFCMPDENDQRNGVARRLRACGRCISLPQITAAAKRIGSFVSVCRFISALHCRHTPEQLSKAGCAAWAIVPIVPGSKCADPRYLETKSLFYEAHLHSPVLRAPLLVVGNKSPVMKTHHLQIGASEHRRPRTTLHGIA